MLRRQMGHRPRMALGTLKRCRYGYPQVLIFAPIQRDGDRISPNSTLCWLSCPLLVREVDRLEKEGDLDRFEHLASADAALREKLAGVHETTAKIRTRLVPGEWAEKLKAERPRDWWVISQTGIAGITRPDHVKCLHAHLADELARHANPVGQEVARILCDQGIPADGTDTCFRYCTPDGASQHLDLSGE